MGDDDEGLVILPVISFQQGDDTASYAARGYFAFGGEWLVVLGVTLLAFQALY